MKKYRKELLAVVVQLVMFYLFPLTCGPTDAMGMVFILLAEVLLLSFLLGLLSANPLKFCWIPAISLLFLPSVPIYYNSSALVHALWYFVLALLGLGCGSLIRLLIRWISKKHTAG